MSQIRYSKHTLCDTLQLISTRLCRLQSIGVDDDDDITITVTCQFECDIINSLLPCEPVLCDRRIRRHCSKDVSPPSSASVSTSKNTLVGGSLHLHNVMAMMKTDTRETSKRDMQCEHVYAVKNCGAVLDLRHSKKLNTQGEVNLEMVKIISVKQARSTEDRK